MNAPHFSQFHGQSFVLGAALACVAMLAIGASPIDGGNTALQHVVSDPLPSSIVRIVEGTPYTVPPNTMLILKAFGTTAPDPSIGGSCLLKINDVTMLGGRSGSDGGVLSNFGFPIVARPGDVVSIEEPFPGPENVLVTGYLGRP